MDSQTKNERTRKTLNILDLVAKLGFVAAAFPLLLGYMIEITAQVEMDSNLFDYTQNCGAFTKCTSSRLVNDSDYLTHERLDDTVHWWAYDVTRVTLCVTFVLLSLFLRVYVHLSSVEKLGERRGLVFDLLGYAGGQFSMFFAVYFILTTFIRSSHLHAWVKNVSNDTIRFSSQTESTFTDENRTEIIAYRVTNETSITGEVKTSYYFVTVGIIFILISGLASLIGCYMKTSPPENSRSSEKLEGIMKHLKKFDMYMMMITQIIVLVIASMIYNQVSDMEKHDMELRFEKGEPNEFETNSLYYTVWVVDKANETSPKFPHVAVPPLLSTSEREVLDANETGFESDIYAISNVCRSQDESMTDPNTVKKVIMTAVAFKSFAVFAQLIESIAELMHKDKLREMPTLTKAIMYSRSLRNLLDYVVFVMVTIISLLVTFNSLSTQCQRTALINQKEDSLSEADYTLRLFIGLVGVAVAMIYQPVHSFDSSKGITDYIQFTTSSASEEIKPTESNDGDKEFIRMTTFSN